MKTKKKAIKKIFGGATIGKRLVLFIFSAVLLPTAIILVLFYGQFYNIIQNSLLDSQMVTSLQAAKYISNSAETLLSVCDTIIGDQRLPVLLASGASGTTSGAAGADDDSGANAPDIANAADNTNVAKATNVDSAADAYTAASETLLAVIDSHVRSNSLSAIRIYTETGDCAETGGVMDPELFSDISEIRNTYWYGIFASQNIDTLFAPDFYLSASERTAYGTLAVIRKQEFVNNGKTTPVFVAVYTYNDILVNPIKDIELESVEGIISFVLNSRDTVVAQTDETAYGTYAMSYEDIALNIPTDGVFIKKEVAGTSVFITYRDIGATDWRMAWIVPEASIMAQSGRFILQFVLIYSLMAVLILIIGIIMSNTIVGRIKSLRNQMRQIKTERPKPLSLIPGKDEVGELIETYNYMVERINTLLDDTIETAEELNNVKIKALRAQIDPHFLYNTLDMIKWLISAGNNDKASDAIIALSRFYRLTLNRGNLKAAVSAELEHVSLYVKLMNMRFDNKIEFLIDIPEHMLDYEIPLIIFQPIVENAIQHGIFEKPSKNGKIIITGWSDDDTLFFLVSDDGIGMTAEQISQLLLTKNDDGASNGIGVYNTHRRLQLMCNRDDCGLYYTSEYGKGTDVTFRISKGVVD